MSNRRFGHNGRALHNHDGSLYQTQPSKEERQEAADRLQEALEMDGIEGMQNKFMYARGHGDLAHLARIAKGTPTVHHDPGGDDNREFSMYDEVGNLGGIG